MLKLEGERSARMADGKARIKAAIAARSLSETSESLRKTSETVVTTAAPQQQQAAAVAVPAAAPAAVVVTPPQQQEATAAAASVLQTALQRKTSEVLGEEGAAGRVQDFFNAAATAANAAPSNATAAAATAGVSADALAMAAFAANTGSEPVVTAAKAEQEKTSEEME